MDSATGMSPSTSRIIVAIPTTGRAPILADTVRWIAQQTRIPDALLISIGGPEDIAPGTADDLPFPIEVLTGPKGGSPQRNRILEALQPGDIAVFLDDDFLMAPDFLAETERLFRDHPDMVLATGTVLADGINSSGFDYTNGSRILAERLAAQPATDRLDPVYNGYGCNMAVRAAPVIEHTLRFDEDLPLYSWLEDVDFSRRLAAHGTLKKAGALRGVHLGTKTGRSKGVLLGYSQVANPIYLIRKGTMHWKRALRLMMGNIFANATRSFKPEPWIDRRGRLWGNALAFRDALTGRMSPGRILDLR